MSLINVYLIAYAVILNDIPNLAALRCDGAGRSWLSEGNIGELGTFPWLGVLRVHLRKAAVDLKSNHDLKTFLLNNRTWWGYDLNYFFVCHVDEGANTRIGLTGLVFIKEAYTIANADDIVRIPRHVFRRDSQAMFIPADMKPWFCKVKDYRAHPEYEYSTLNTIAIIELALDNEDIVPMAPICLPNYSFNTSNHLYAMGYTDEHQFLEKTLHKLQYVDLKSCEEFYNRADLSKGLVLPSHYQCAYAVSNKDNCVWESGMVLASNSTGTWNLIGLSIKGPGCAAPARFINLLPYFSWIESIMSLGEHYSYPEYGRKFSKGSRKKVQIEDIPAHDLFRSNGSRRTMSHPMLSNMYPFDVEASAFLNVERLDKDAIQVSTFDTEYAKSNNSCSDYKMQIYRELTKVVAPGLSGSAHYKLTLYDMMARNYTCIKIKIECLNRTDAFLYYKTYVDFKEGTAFGTFGDTPEDILKVFPIEKLQTPNTTVGDIWKPGSKFKTEFLGDSVNKLDVPNINLWVQFTFRERAVLKFEIYGDTVPTPYTPKTKKIPTRRLDKLVNYRRVEKMPLVNDKMLVNVTSDARRASEFSVFGILLASGYQLILQNLAKRRLN